MSGFPRIQSVHPDLNFATTPTLLIDGQSVPLKGKVTPLKKQAGEETFAGTMPVGSFDLSAEIPPARRRPVAASC